MKKILLYSILLLQIKMVAQVLPNGSFEIFNSFPYSDPTGWYSANFRAMQQFDYAPVYKVTGFTGYAVHMETIIAGTDTTEAFVSNTKPGCSDPSSWMGGVPYTHLPTAITGHYRYDLPGNDTALLIVIFKKNGATVGNNIIKIRGTGSMPTFTAFSFPVTASITPDTMIIAATSSNLISRIGIESGSFLELDNLAFTGASAAIPYGDFDGWDAKGILKPGGWDGYGSDDSALVHTTDSYHGTYAVRLKTELDNCGNANGAGITTGHMQPHSGPTGGRPYTTSADTLCGYYKYTSIGNDSAALFVSLMASGANVGGGVLLLPGASAYTYFQIPFFSGSAPDTMRIDVQSSKWPTTAANAGSTLFLDKLWLKSAPDVGILSYDNASDVAVYPNPSSDFIIINMKGDFINTEKIIRIYNNLGEKILEIKSIESQLKFDFKSFAKGIYMLQILTEKGIITKKFVKE